MSIKVKRIRVESVWSYVGSRGCGCSAPHHSLVVWYSLVAKMIRVTRHVGDVGYVVTSVDKMEPRASYGSDGVRTSNRD
jgi:hypothetical protein